MSAYSRLARALPLIAAASAFVSVLCTAGSCQVTEQKGIAVSGQGEVSAVPDIARVSVGVVTQGKDAGKTAVENAKKADAVVSAIVAAGAAKKDIQTARYSVEAQYDYQ